jgi:transposase
MTMFSLVHGVFEWYVRFRDDHESLKHDESRGRSTAVRTPDIEAVRELISTDLRMTLRMMEEELEISRKTIHKS